MQKLRDFGRAFTIECIILKREIGYVIKNRKVRGSTGSRRHSMKYEVVELFHSGVKLIAKNENFMLTSIKCFQAPQQI